MRREDRLLASPHLRQCPPPLLSFPSLHPPGPLKPPGGSVGQRAAPRAAEFLQGFTYSKLVLESTT